jgi:hypothetical protein
MFSKQQQARFFSMAISLMAIVIFVAACTSKHQ